MTRNNMENSMIRLPGRVGTLESRIEKNLVCIPLEPKGTDNKC
ncbi:hypothetical protein SAMN04488505_104375 [Chitinophaga rupis]|uniref:Uncharacterized protein n=1 Tax=Chitinophaga rupis TaxID=573321 RepID=A0A1H7YAH4_9BACT|nr:hypothetical protein SAMN04488505_104375 [Chitinophaga rupis]